MSGRILIIDSVVTHRIVLKVKIVSAQYSVDTCASCEEARALMAQTMPDLIMINLSDPVEDRHAFCREIRNSRETADMPLIAVGIPDIARARFAALDCGCDDVLPTPISDTMMLARVRSLMRRRTALQEWQLRDGTSRALGFEDEAAPRLTPPIAAVLSDLPMTARKLGQTLREALAAPVQTMSLQKALLSTPSSAPPDVLIVDGTADQTPQRGLFRLVAELRARHSTRHAVQLVLVPPDRPEVGAMLLDLGADDVMTAAGEPEELCLRVKNLLQRKFRQDGLRDRVRNGLHAAVTDPLTGLFNRRYAEAHLERIAEQTHATGGEYAIMMLDIDHFKSINDRFGHAAGDLVLRELAGRLRGSFRSIDLVARVGGEEFLVAMPNTSAEQAEYAADRIRRLIGDTPFQIGEAHSPLRVTISVGVAVDGLSGTATRHVFERADAALYAAKSSGRDAVSVACNAA